MPERTFPIAYVAGAFPLRSETFVWREVRELRRRGWPVHTFGLHAPAEVPDTLADLRRETRDVYDGPTPRPRAAGLYDAVRPGERLHLRDRMKLPVQAGAGRRLAIWCRQRGVRHVHAHFAHAPTTVAMYAARAAGIGFSFTGHANDLFQRRQLLLRKLERASFVACISRWHRDLYRDLVPGGADKFHVIRCGVPLPTQDRPPPAVPGRLRVLAVGRLVEKKGFDTLIGAAGRLEGVTVTIAGDGPLRAELEGQAAGTGVTFLGAVDNARVTDLLAEHDAVALSCRPDASGDKDGIPVVLMEAMAAALPVVAGDLPAIRELILPGETGRLVPAAAGLQVELALADVLRDWRDDPATRASTGVRGRLHVAQEFELGANVSRLEKCLRSAVPG